MERPGALIVFVGFIHGKSAHAATIAAVGVQSAGSLGSASSRLDWGTHRAGSAEVCPLVEPKKRWGLEDSTPATPQHVRDPSVFAPHPSHLAPRPSPAALTPSEARFIM